MQTPRCCLSLAIRSRKRCQGPWWEVEFRQNSPLQPCHIPQNILGQRTELGVSWLRSRPAAISTYQGLQSPFHFLPQTLNTPLPLQPHLVKMQSVSSVKYLVERSCLRPLSMHAASQPLGGPEAWLQGNSLLVRIVELKAQVRQRRQDGGNAQCSQQMKASKLVLQEGQASLLPSCLRTPPTCCIILSCIASSTSYIVFFHLATKFVAMAKRRKFRMMHFMFLSRAGKIQNSFPRMQCGKRWTNCDNRVMAIVTSKETANLMQLPAGFQ